MKIFLVLSFSFCLFSISIIHAQSYTTHIFQNYNSDNTPKGNPDTQVVENYVYNSYGQLSYLELYNIILYKLCQNDILEHLAFVEHYDSIQVYIDHYASITGYSVARENFYYGNGGTISYSTISTISPTDSTQWNLHSKITYNLNAYIYQVFNNDNKLSLTAQYPNGWRYDTLYDGNNNVIGNNTYDKYNRLILANYGSQQIAYTYDTNARLSSRSYTYVNAGGQKVTKIYGYDRWGNEYPNSTTPVLLTKVPPRSFALEQNYPNPFNQKTLIRYNVLENSPVSLRIYMIDGHLVQTLVNENQSSGHYSVFWNGMNDKGKIMARGVYLYQLINNGRIISKKMNFIE